MSAKNHGKILYWHHEHSDEINGLYPLAVNFEEFITRLFNVSDEEKPAEGVSIKKVSDKFLDRLKKSGKK